MRPIDKLRANIQEWQRQDEEAREILAVTERVLPSLLKQLEELEAEEEKRAPCDPPLVPAETVARSEPPALKEETEQQTSQTSEAGPTFTGDAVSQVEQALRWKSPQSSDDLLSCLEKYGRAYSRGAIGFGIRDLKKAGTIREAKKVGNLRYYEIIPEHTEQGVGM